jgi:hypothetical protein
MCLIGFLHPRIAVEIGLMRVVHSEQVTCGEAVGNLHLLVFSYIDAKYL